MVCAILYNISGLSHISLTWSYYPLRVWLSHMMIHALACNKASGRQTLLQSAACRLSLVVTLLSAATLAEAPLVELALKIVMSIPVLPKTSLYLFTSSIQ